MARARADVLLPIGCKSCVRLVDAIQRRPYMIHTALQPSAELSNQSAGQAFQLRRRLGKLVQCCFLIIAIDGRRTSLQFGVDHPPNGHCGLIIAQCVP
jgi:hypothetical protein